MSVDHMSIKLYIMDMKLWISYNFHVISGYHSSLIFFLLTNVKLFLALSNKGTSQAWIWWLDHCLSINSDFWLEILVQLSIDYWEWQGFLTAYSVQWRFVTYIIQLPRTNVPPFFNLILLHWTKHSLKLFKLIEFSRES